MQIDGNIWAGIDIIKDDPNTQNQNSKIFKNLFARNLNLCVVNALSVCEGKITWQKHTKNGTEQSILDLFLVCDQVLPLVDKMIVDEKGGMTLTKYQRGMCVKSDHNMLNLEINMTFHEEKDHEKIKMFNLRNNVCQDDFREKTTNTKAFTKCFENEESINVQFENDTESIPMPKGTELGVSGLSNNALSGGFCRNSDQPVEVTSLLGTNTHQGR